MGDSPRTGPPDPTEPGDPKVADSRKSEGHRDETVPVVAAVVERDGTYLVALRPRRKRHGGHWEFPGGKVADGESDADALERELAEELGVTVTGVGPTLFTGRDGDTPYSIRFRRVDIRGEPTAHEHDEIRWVSASGLLNLSLAPLDREFAAVILAPGAADVAGGNGPTYLAGMPSDQRDPDRGPRLPRPSRARFPGWLLPLLGGVAGGFVAGWWGAAFGAVVGFLVWRTRA